DLCCRVNGGPIEMAPLRKRAEGSAVLARHFLEAANRRSGRSVAGFTDAALDALIGYRWPGNVRELENLIERLVVIKGEGLIDIDDLPPKLQAPTLMVPGTQPPTRIPTDCLNLPGTLATIERKLIQDALRRAGGNKNRAAALLGLNRTTLVEKLKRQN